MARNIITAEATENGWLFTGSIRQPTPVEISNYCVEHHIYIEGVYISAVRITGMWLDPADVRTVELVGWGDHCPVCARELDISGVSCPVCGRRWDA